MGEATDKDDFHAYAVHGQEMAASATEADIKGLWLRMAAAWRRRSRGAAQGHAGQMEELKCRLMPGDVCRFPKNFNRVCVLGFLNFHV